jgi:hypothetical protein
MIKGLALGWEDESAVIVQWRFRDGVLGGARNRNWVRLQESINRSESHLGGRKQSGVLALTLIQRDTIGKDPGV